MIKVHCPICGRSLPGHGRQDWPEWPFCSPRCKLIDLGRWLGGDYRVAAAPAAEDSAGTEDDPPKPAAPSAVPHREEA